MTSPADLGFWWVVVANGRETTVHGHEGRTPPRIGEAIKIGAG